jgi:hypothetical protein
LIESRIWISTSSAALATGPQELGSRLPFWIATVRE